MVSKTEETQLSNLETQVDNGGGGAWEYLSLVRKLKVRRSDRVLKHGLSILNDPKKRSSLGPDGESRALFFCSFQMGLFMVLRLIWIGFGLGFGLDSEIVWFLYLGLFSFALIQLGSVYFAVFFFKCFCFSGLDLLWILIVLVVFVNLEGL